jgi:hypothetical protein
MVHCDTTRTRKIKTAMVHRGLPGGVLAYAW